MDTKEVDTPTLRSILRLMAPLLTFLPVMMFLSIDSWKNEKEVHFLNQMMPNQAQG
jgi:hypothetical protein